MSCDALFFGCYDEAQTDVVVFQNINNMSYKLKLNLKESREEVNRVLASSQFPIVRLKRLEVAMCGSSFF